MTLKPVGDARPNTFRFETTALVKASGFREYDARWWFGHPGSDKPPELNLMGVQALGMGLGTLIRRLGVGPEIVTGHDFRGYSMSIKLALVSGLMAAGARVKDIGLALSPMAYFAQFALDAPSVAMVTASHNENGWTGVKMGARRPLTFGPDEMSALKDIVLDGDFDLAGGGSYAFVPDFRQTYLDDVTAGRRLKRRLKVVAACGNGTAGAFAPADAGAHRLRGRAARHRARLHLPQLQPEPRRHGDAARHPRQGAGDRRRHRPRLRRRRRPLRRGRQRGQRDLRRQGRRHAGARHLLAASGRHLRRRRQVDRPLRHRPGAEARTARSRTTGRPAIPTSSGASPSSAPSPASRSPATSSSTRRSAAATTTGWSPPSPSARCSTATPASRWPTSTATCR